MQYAMYKNNRQREKTSKKGLNSGTADHFIIPL